MLTVVENIEELEQLDEYLARLRQDEGWLVIFVAEGGRSHRRDNSPEI